jgi:hypothetical protein
MTDGPTLHELYKQASGDRDEYRRLMVEHGYLIPLNPGEVAEPLPCGWPGKQRVDWDPDEIGDGAPAGTD